MPAILSTRSTGGGTLIKAGLWWLATLGIVGILITINPRLLRWGDAWVDTPMDFIPGPFATQVLRPIEGVGDATYNYRDTIERSGDSRTEISLPLKLKWSYGTLNLGIHGASKTTPAVDDQGVVIGADTSWLYSFDRNGKLQWKFYAGHSDRGIHSTPSLTDEQVFVGAYNGRVYALDRKTGEPLWVTVLGQTIGASPVLHEGFLYWSVEIFNPPDGYLVKMDARNGQVVWRSDLLGEQSHSSPVIDVEHAMVFAGDNKSQMTAFDLRTGKQLWRYPALGPIKGTASWWNNHLYFTDWGRNLYKLNSLTGQLAWNFELGARSQSSVTLVPEEQLGVFGANDKTIYAVDLQSGKLRWKVSAPAEDLRGSFTLAREKGNGRRILIGPCSSSEVCVLEARSGSILQRIEVGSTVTSVPTIRKGRVFIATDLKGLLVFE